MKKLLLILGFLLNTFSQQIFSQADQQLSNLTGTVAINRSLVPGSDYSNLDLGNSANAWKSIYVGSSDADSISSYIMYYTGNIFLHNRGGASTGNSEGLFIGEFAGQNVSNVASVNNGCVGVGFNALQNLGDGYSGSSTGVGNHNTAIGWRSLYWLNGSANDVADKNTMVGSKSGELISYGKENTGVGWNVFFKNGVMTPPSIYGSYNVGIGAAYVLGSLTSGSYNTALGYGSGTAITSGSYNILIGNSSGTTITSTDNNIIIGIGENPTLSSMVSCLNIGGTIYGDLANDKISIGNYGASISSMFNVGTSDQFQVNSAGIIPVYKNIATIGNGVPAEYAEVDLTLQNSSLGPSTLYAVPADEGGLYRISFTIKVTTIATNSVVNLQIKYTDNDDAVVATMPSANINGVNQTQANSTTTGVIGGCFVVNAKGGTNIQYITNYASSPGGTMKYSLHLKMEKL